MTTDDKRRELLREYLRDEPDSHPDISASLFSALESVDGPSDTKRLAAAVQTSSRPILQRRALHAFRMRVLRGVLLSLIPLACIVAYDFVVLTAVRDVLAAWLPDLFATWIVFNYAVFLLLAFAATYAAVPILASRMRPSPWMAREAAPAGWND